MRLRSAVAVLVVAAVPLSAVVAPANAGGDRIDLVSVGVDGGGGNGPSFAGTEKGLGVSAHGRYVVFSSYASDLVAGDTNGDRDVFVRDTVTGRTTLVSVGVNGAQGNGESRQGSISADGRYVAFNSYATNLFPGDTNDGPDVFVRDLRTGRTTLVSTGLERLANHGAHQPEISADGRHVVFTSASTNLVAGDTNDFEDIFVRDLRAGRTERVSLTADGQQTAIFSRDPAISADGRIVAFTSENSRVLVRDRAKKTTRVVSDGVVIDPGTFIVEMVYLSVSGDGGSVLFTVVEYGGPFDAVANIWLRDLRTDRLRLITADDQGRPNSTVGPVFRSDVSADGRYVTFGTPARLTAADTGNLSDVFRLDRRTGARVWITRKQDQNPPNGGNGSVGPAISDDGQHVAFDSDNQQLVPGGSPSGNDTYLWSTARR
ncbi:TolB family protein [Kribbella sp. CA-247076]|uniref:TolB family protein n=1 Tax=Kribbella sp. CA-247076 TaxID=3239941 RepID=UPI003D9320D4